MGSDEAFSPGTTKATVLSSPKSYNIAVIGGDGTGPEVIAEGVKVLNAASGKYGFKLNFVPYDLGGERYLRTGEILPGSVLGELRKVDAIYLGAIGHPDVKPGILEKGILLELRFKLDQYINLRPVRLFPGVETPVSGRTPADIDYVVIRENSGDLYTGIGGFSRRETPNEVAVQVSVYDREMVDRCLRWSFEYTRKYGKKAMGKTVRDPEDPTGSKRIPAQHNTLALIGKTNVLTYVYDLWERAFHEMGARNYPDIRREYYHVDATCMWMIKNPEWFDVMVTGNMFGDIITDLGAITQGGMGVAAGGNINPYGVSMFEPIGGSAPKWKGKNAINPIAAIVAGGMMLEQLGEHKAAAGIETAVRSLCPGMKSQAAGKMGYTTTEVGDLVAGLVADPSMNTSSKGEDHTTGTEFMQRL